MNEASAQRGASRRLHRVRAGCWVVIAVPLGFACSDERRGAPPAVPVTVAQAEQRTVPFEITAPGTVEPMRAVAVSAQVSGIVTSVRFREGEEVREGAVLVQIDPRPYRNALQQADATLARDLIQLENARRQVARYQGLAQSVKRFGGDDPEHFVRKLLVTAKREGKVRTLFLGRERSLPQLNSPNPVLRRAAEEEAVETVVEGSCAEILKLGLLKLQRRLDQEGCRTRVIFLLADGFLLELPEEEEGLVHQIVKQELERAVVTTPPWVVLIAVGPRWGKMEGS